MSEHSINHLGDLVKQILNTLRKFMHEIMDALNVLKVIPDTLAQIRQDMNSGFDRLIQAQGEMEIYTRMARLRSKEQLITSENEAIEDFEKQLNEDFDTIDKRYSKINGELDAECKKRVSSIDAHLLEIPTKFPNDYITAFNKKIIPLLEKLMEDADLAYHERLQILEIAVEKSRTMISGFIETRKGFFEMIKDYEIPGNNDAESEMYIPIWIMELGDKDGASRETHALLPGSINIIKAKKFTEVSSTLDTKGAFTMLNSAMSQTDNKANMVNAFNWKRDHSTNSALKDEFSEYFNSVFEGKHENVRKEFVSLIANSPIDTLN